MTADVLAAPAFDPPAPPSRGRFILVALLIIVGMAVMALWIGSETRRTETARAVVRASYARRIMATELLLYLTEAESSQRGYVVTGDPVFLAVYSPSQIAVWSDLSHLRVAYADQPDQTARLAEITELASAKFREMDDVIGVRDRAGIEQAARRVADREGWRLMEGVRHQVAGLVSTEDRNLGNNLRLVRQRNHDGVVTTWTLMALGTVILLIVIAVLWRNRGERHRLVCDAYAASVRLHSIFASTIDGIVIIDPAGRIETMNASASRKLGYSPAEVRGRDAVTLFDVADGEGSFRDRIGLRDGEVTRAMWLDRNIRTKDGTILPVDIAFGVMSLGDEKHVVASIRDISERKAAEHAKDEFLATVSHELRTPLTSVVGSLGLLRAGSVGELPPPAQRLVEIAENNSRRLIRLINDILDIEKIGSGKMHFQRDPVDVARVGAAAADAARGLADARGVRIETRIAPGRMMVRGDTDRLIQVMSNLLSNAVRHSPANGRVLLIVSAEGDTVTCAVEDQGTGVPKEFHGRIFERFSQASSGTVSGGTGLGLAISREIVEAHGGQIGFGDAPGGGARFYFTLPMLKAEPPEALKDAGRARFLVCEDDREAAEVLSGMLTREGCSVDTVSTAADAQQAMQSGRYDGVLLDLRLPDASGLEAVRALRRDSRTRNVPIIVVSATATDSGTDPTAAALEVVDWIDKPVDSSRLVHAVERAIHHSSASRPTMLHVDDDIDMLEVTATALADQGRMLRATGVASARAILNRQSVDIVILDLNLADGSGLELLPDLMTADGVAIPTIIYSAQDVIPELQQQVDAVLVKSRRSLPSLAATINRLLAESRRQPPSESA